MGGGPPAPIGSNAPVPTDEVQGLLNDDCCAGVAVVHGFAAGTETCPIQVVQGFRQGVPVPVVQGFTVAPGVGIPVAEVQGFPPIALVPVVQGFTKAGCAGPIPVAHGLTA
jgi:hypothetical protein